MKSSRYDDESENFQAQDEEIKEEIFQNENIRKRKFKENIKNEVKKKVKEKVAKKVGKTIATKGAIMSVIGPIIAWAIVVLIVLIGIIGTIVFLITLPGMVLEKLKQLGKMIAEAVASWFGADTTKMVDDSVVYESLDYLEDMGYDLKGYGFLTDYMDDWDFILYCNENDITINQEYFMEHLGALATTLIKGQSDDEKSSSDAGTTEASLDLEKGVIRNSDEQIVKAASDFLMAYQISDNYVYTVKNKNLVTDEGFKGKLQALGRHVSDFFGGSLGNHWTRGMLAFYEESLFGAAGDFYSDGGLFDFDNLKLDAENRTLSLENSSTFNNNNPIVYNLDGWTGRYGMPIDFLLSIHIATMMPDLAYDMANSFETEVRIILHSMEGEYADAAFFNKGEYIPYTVFEDLAGTGALGTDIGGALNSWKLNNKEAMLIMKKLNIDSPETCLGTTEMNDQEIYNFESAYGDSELDIQSLINDYNSMIDKIKSEGYSNNDISEISTIEEFEELLIHSKILHEPDNYEENEDKDDEFKMSSLIISETKSVVDTSRTSFDYNKLSYSWIKNEDSPYYVDIFMSKFIIELGDSEYITYGISYSIMRKRSEEEIQEFLEKTGVDSVEQARCSQLDNKECCDNCKDYIKTIYDLLAEPHDSDYDFYIPYIESVKNHWYRNVYFTKPNNVDFVQNDYEYESLIKERWTEYETYPTDENAHNYNPDRIGEFILYRIYTEEDHKKNPHYIAGEYQKSESGNYVIFDGTLDEAKEQGIAVAKKAKTIDSNSRSTLFDLGWNPETLSGLWNIGMDWINQSDVARGIWSAYALTNNQSTIWERTYADSELEEENDQTIKLVKQNLYSKIVSSFDIIQTGDGQRGETNPNIKNMFLSNTYFRYDGSPETAEKITLLRQKIKANLGEGQSEYGALNNLNNKDYTNKMLTPNGKLVDVVEDSDLSNSIEKEENIKIKDYSGQVTINQDALNAFSMLENSHTLDADYIYRDFKELIVELGYFTKEELTDETPRLLQWIVPEIGSTGYPNRTIDKRENESGTMIHSKLDISANDKYTLTTLIRESEKADEVEGDLPSEPQQIAQTNQNRNSSFSIKANGDDDFNAVMGNSAISQVQTINTSVSVDEFLEIAEEVHARMEGDVWEYCWGSDTHKTGNNSRHWRENESHERYKTYKEAEEGNKTADCSSYVCWVLQEAGILPENTLMRSTEFIEGDWFKGYVIPIEQAGEWQPGDILAKAAVGNESGHVQINGKDGMQYNAGSDKAIQTPPHVYEPEFGPTHIIRLPFGIDSPEQPYLGYSGNEAVVSPVTGILLEYGTYDNEGITPELLEKKANRINVDLKYGPLNYSSKVSVEDSKTQEKDGSGGYLSKIVADEVGYARILVLDATHYQALEQSTNNIWKDIEGAKTNDSQSLVSENGVYNEYLISNDEKTAVEILEELEETSPLSTTVYGYKEFAELYSKFGIAGYEIFIDGFIPELPDDNCIGKLVMAEELPDGEDIDIDYFKKITQNNFETEKQLDNKYIPDEEYKFPSESYTDKYKAETAVKKMATSSIYVPSSDNKITNEDLIFIKEGTVLGRTMTDRELLEDIRDGQTGTYEENRPKEKSTENGKIDQIIGNYLRIIMKNETEEIVENVEDYMKIETDNAISLEAAIRALEAINKNSSIKDKVVAMINYYIAMGFTKEAAAGIVANAFSESSLDPTSHTAGTSFYGLYQMDMGVATDNPLEAVEGSNWDMQMKWMEENGYNYDSFAGQVRAVIECENYLAGRNSWGNIEQMKVRKDPKDAAEYWEVWIEGAIGGDSIEENASTWGPYWAKINGHYAPDSEEVMYYQGLARRKRRAEMAMDIYDGKTETFSE